MKRFRMCSIFVVLLAATMPLTGTHASRATGKRINFSGPTAVAVDPQGHIYVADVENARVDKLAGNGRLLGTIGRFPLHTQPPQTPFSVASDARGNVYVGLSISTLQNPAGPFSGRVQEFSPMGRLLKQFGADPSGSSHLLGAGFSPAIDAQGDVYVSEAISATDQGTWNIRKFAPSGKPLATWHVNDRPTGIAIDAEGMVYVTELTRRNIVKMSPNGKILATVVGPTAGVTPSTVTVDKHGNLYVVDGPSSRVMKFGPDGRLLRRWGRYGAKPGQFDFCPVVGSAGALGARPMGIALDAVGNVYVSENCNQRIQKFSPNGKLLAVFR